MSARDKLVALLDFYLKTSFTAAGLAWTPENSVEVGIIGARIGQMIDEAIEAHCENRPRIHADGSTS